MNQQPDRFDPMTGQPLNLENNHWVKENNYQTGVDITYLEESTSGTLRKKLVGLGIAAVLVAGLCVFLLFFFKPTDTEYVFYALKSTFAETGNEVQLSEAKELLDSSLKNGKYMMEVTTGDEYLSSLGFYVDAAKKKLLLKAEGDQENFQLYLDDEEVSFGSSEEVIFLNFSDFKSKFRDCPLMQESNGEVSEEDVEKMDKVLTELRALIWDALSTSSLDNEEQEKNFEEFKEKMVVEKKGKRELSSKKGEVSCTVYQVAVDMDALTDFFIQMLDNGMMNKNEHLENILSMISNEEVGENFENSKQMLFDELRTQMEKAKKELGDKLFFDVCINSNDRMAGIAFEWKIQEENVNMEFLCPSGNIAEEARLVLTNGREQMSISNEGEVSGDVFKGSLRAEQGGQGGEILSYEYNLKNGDFCFVPNGDSGDALRGKFYLNKEKGQIEIAIYLEDEEVSAIFGKLDMDIEKPSGKRYDLLEESTESLSQIGIMKKYLIGESYDQPAIEEGGEEFGLYDDYDFEDYEDYGFEDYD